MANLSLALLLRHFHVTAGAPLWAKAYDGED
jgi:hypothetical protein